MAVSQPTHHVSATPDPEGVRALTWKSLMLGLLLVLAASLGGFYARHILYTTRLAQNHLSLAVVFPYILTVVLLRGPLKLGMMIVYLGITRIIAETGVITIRAAMVSQSFIMLTFGTAGISGSSMTALAMTSGWHGDVKTTLMPALAHCVKLFDTIKQQKRQLVWAAALAMGVGIVSSVLYIIVMAYETGARNYGSQISGWRKMAFLGSGIVFATFLYATRYRYTWWPFHPLGLAAGPAYPVTNVVFPIFLGGVAKFAIVHVGEAKAYRAARPFFVGLIMGYYVGSGISFFVDWIWFPGNGHGFPFSG